MSQAITLRYRDCCATISQRGAEPVAWSVGGRDLLWKLDPDFWDRTSPLLFPIVGWANGGKIHVAGCQYRIGVHGFAAAQEFDLTSRTDSSASFRSEDTATTRAQFPFRFRLDATYALTASGLSAEFEVTNPGNEQLPYALGFHPGFAWPFARGERDGYVIEFAEAERPNVPIITAGGLFSKRDRPIALQGKRLALNDALFANEALCWLDAQSSSLRFIAPNGKAIDMTLEDFPHIALWSRPGAPFLSIEAWTGHGDPDGFIGDIHDKPSMRLLAPGASARHAIRMTYRP